MAIEHLSICFVLRDIIHGYICGLSHLFFIHTASRRIHSHPTTGPSFNRQIPILCKSYVNTLALVQYQHQQPTQPQSQATLYIIHIVFSSKSITEAFRVFRPCLLLYAPWTLPHLTEHSFRIFLCRIYASASALSFDQTFSDIRNSASRLTFVYKLSALLGLCTLPTCLSPISQVLDSYHHSQRARILLVPELIFVAWTRNSDCTVLQPLNT